MANLDLTIGLDQSELEKGLAGAGKKLGALAGSVQAGKNPFNAAAGQLSSGMGIGSLLGGPIGGVIGAFVGAFGAAISGVIRKVKELADYAQNLRRLSIQTGLSIQQLSNMEGFASAFGVSVQSLAGSFTEFTRRMGEVRIKGGELTNILAKMGIGMDEVANGTFNHQKAMMALADAYAAGTDEATLLYYGTKMFGDSFKELLPIIKSGSKAVEDASKPYLKVRDEAAGALARLGQDMSNIWQSYVINPFINMLGSVVEEIEKLQSDVNNLFSKGFFNPFESKEDKAKRVIENAPKHMTNKEIVDFVLERYYDEDERDEARKELEKQLKGNGKVLTPFGMSEAGAASQMQQMGGGDIFGAVAFTPLERIATATEATAEHTRPRDEPTPRTPDELSR
jgi:gas vesicle protein